MDPLAWGRQVYEQCREVLQTVRPFVAGNDELRWAVEDLDDALLDLKLAILDGNRNWAGEYARECRRLAEDLIDLL